ncbi:hypothetical protein [Pedobacter miscanthi]|uniref:Uncharacterized protein n=1 Tax=Pedobacter miscanthi TaxID=2259170 RepID=A0A366KUU9_9SPHI|nr:hypothetical protein [Pedobacter miscanthi]RBQ05406.1 hypothetical protein DRW42_15555 [Pedobacter miscanthi]
MKHKIYYLTILAALFSCKKEIKQEFLLPSTTVLERQDSKTIFSKTLAIALEKEPALRTFIKKEALKQFDMDNDVLFQMVKGNEITSGKTFYQVLTQYATSKNDLDNAIKNLPTLTIMVPEVINFSIKSWNPLTEIPKVAVSPENKNFKQISIYDEKGEIINIPSGYLPGFPVVVVKENERVAISAKGNTIMLQDGPKSLEFLSKGDLRFNFVDQAFDGTNNNLTPPSSINSSGLPLNLNSKISRSVSTQAIGSPLINVFNIDQKVVDAYNVNLDWHRDNIYYGLNPNAGIVKGKFNNRVAEYIVSIRMADGNLAKISDEPKDPKDLNKFVTPRPPRNGDPVIKDWTDGFFEFRIAILINAKNGAGTQLNKNISAVGSDLYNLITKQTGNPRNPVYEIIGLEPKDYFINEKLIPWDLENYGAAWKFIVSEFDESATSKKTYNETAKFVTNFNYEATFGEVVKVGLKAGATQETSSSNTFEYVTTTGSDELGEGILEFGSPIILRKDTKSYVGRNGTIVTTEEYITNEVSCGQIFLSIEPRQF